MHGQQNIKKNYFTYFALWIVYQTLLICSNIFRNKSVLFSRILFPMTMWNLFVLFTSLIKYTEYA